MKYIKSYEDIENNDDFKKYLITKSDENNYLCIEIISIDEFEKIAHICTMSFSKNNTIHKSVEISITLESLKSLKKRLIYQSDDINDIINNLKIIKDLDKYNL